MLSNKFFFNESLFSYNKVFNISWFIKSNWDVLAPFSPEAANAPALFRSFEIPLYIIFLSVLSVNFFPSFLTYFVKFNGLSEGFPLPSAK
jgi:hypothetical protein